MRVMLVGLLVLSAALVAVPRADAGELNALFDLSVRLGQDGLTLGGRVDTPRGPASGAITGRLRPGGIVIDGWVDDRGQTWGFELDAGVVEGGLRAVIRRPPQRI